MLSWNSGNDYPVTRRCRPEVRKPQFHCFENAETHSWKLLIRELKYCREESLKWLECQRNQDFEEIPQNGASVYPQRTIRLIISFCVKHDCQVRKTALKMDGGEGHYNLTCGFVCVWKSVTVRTQDILRTKYWGLSRLLFIQLNTQLDCSRKILKLTSNFTLKWSYMFWFNKPSSGSLLLCFL